MDIKQYLKKYDITVVDFAKKIGKSRAWMYWLIKGGRPTLETAELIEKATEGYVTKKDLLKKRDEKDAKGHLISLFADEKDVSYVFYEKKLHQLMKEAEELRKIIKQSKSDGIEEGKQFVAQQMKKEGFDIKTISKCTAIPVEVLEEVCK